MVNMLALQDIHVNHKRVRRLLRKMDINAVYPRKCLSKGGKPVGWRLSNTLSATNCHELLRECVGRYGAPEILNSDQGSQFTTQAWLDLLDGFDIKVSMDGKGRCQDNIWIERFWRTIKQEYVYLNPAESVDELRQGIDRFMQYYNYKRPHQSIEELLPCMRYGVVA